MFDEQPVRIEVVPGGPRLEARLALAAQHRGGAVICHPHRLYGFSGSLGALGEAVARRACRDAGPGSRGPAGEAGGGGRAR